MFDQTSELKLLVRNCFHPFEVKSRKCNVSSNEMNGSVLALGEHQSVCVLVNLYK